MQSLAEYKLVTQTEAGQNFPEVGPLHTIRSLGGIQGEYGPTPIIHGRLQIQEKSSNIIGRGPGGNKPRLIAMHQPPNYFRKSTIQYSGKEFKIRVQKGDGAVRYWEKPVVLRLGNHHNDGLLQAIR